MFSIEKWYYNGTSWTLSTVDSAGMVGLYTSLELDSTGLARISYFDDTADDLKYAAYNGTSWTISTVDSAGNTGNWTSLELDSADKPTISYFYVTTTDLRVATVPEPATPLLLGSGMMLLLRRRRTSAL